MPGWGLRGLKSPPTSLADLSLCLDLHLLDPFCPFSFCLDLYSILSVPFLSVLTLIESLPWFSFVVHVRCSFVVHVHCSFVVVVIESSVDSFYSRLPWRFVVTCLRSCSFSSSFNIAFIATASIVKCCGSTQTSLIRIIEHEITF